MLIGAKSFQGHDEKYSARLTEGASDLYFSADVETDGPIPGPYSILSFAIVYAGSFDGRKFVRPRDYDRVFYRELRPISDSFQQEALDVNGLDRDRLCAEGLAPDIAMAEAFNWITANANGAKPVLVAYPLSFDWTWLYWYFMKFCSTGSPFDYSRCFDIKTAHAVKAGIPISRAGRSKLDRIFIKRHTLITPLMMRLSRQKFLQIYSSGRALMSELARRRNYSQQRIEELRGKLANAGAIASGKACVYATGSFGRKEASSHSDLDLFIAGKYRLESRSEGDGQRLIVKNLLNHLDEICVFVMPGLVPGIHVFGATLEGRRGWPGQARP